MRQLKILNSFTSRESISIEKYLNEVSKIELLSPEEEYKLAQRIRDGDQEALDMLTKANLRFVISVAKQYQNNGLSLSDLINEGNVGLIKAAKRFDETKGFKFISYAVWWIRQSIISAIVEYSRIVRIPVNKSNLYNKIREAIRFFMQEFEREPSKEELADLLDVSVNMVEESLRSQNQATSMDSPLMEDDGGLTLLDLIPDESGASPDLVLLKESLKDQVQIELSKLSPREHYVLSSYFGLDDTPTMSLDEISGDTGLSRERVRQIKDRGLVRLKRSLSRNNLKTYLGE
jgi:RNA polymerase primary sigma factor